MSRIFAKYRNIVTLGVPVKFVGGFFKRPAAFETIIAPIFYSASLQAMLMLLTSQLGSKSYQIASLRTSNVAEKVSQLSASLLNTEPFEPVFKVEDKKVRIEKITITQGKLTVRLAPASD